VGSNPTLGKKPLPFFKEKQMSNPETIRQEHLVKINNESGERETLQARHGDVWDTAELGQAFEVQGFMAPYVVVKRRSDGVVGSLQFQHSPRFYFNFQKDA
jgi:hypothetical protein